VNVGRSALASPPMVGAVGAQGLPAQRDSSAGRLPGTELAWCGPPDAPRSQTHAAARHLDVLALGDLSAGVDRDTASTTRSTARLRTATLSIGSSPVSGTNA
jgi:hypothetical protein